MIINHTHRFIFVHVPKTAGTSVSTALSKYSTYRDLEIGGTPLGEAVQPFMSDRFGLRKHSTAANIRDVVGAASFQSYFSFCLVRNPFNRLQSTYHFLKGWKGCPKRFAAKLDRFESFLDSHSVKNSFHIRILPISVRHLGRPQVRLPQ
jgi:hypothetical protein